MDLSLEFTFNLTTFRLFFSPQILNKFSPYINDETIHPMNLQNYFLENVHINHFFPV